MASQSSSTPQPESLTGSPRISLKNEETSSTQLQQAIASLQLPHMPSFLSPKSSPSRVPSSRRIQPKPVATLKILVVADLDLASSSALAEYTLQQKNYGMFDANRIDLCVACGPFCRDDDLRLYERGRQQHLSHKKSRRRNVTSETNGSVVQPHKESMTSSRRHQRAPLPWNLNEAAAGPARPESLDWTATPFCRTREETASLEGLMTAALSQLESIVCRVVYCPGSSDPLSTLAAQRSHYRLTPNSRNVHQQWLPMAPGLGCGGIFYLDQAEDVQGAKSKRAAVHEGEAAADGRFENDSDASGEQEENDLAEILSAEIESLRQIDGYFPTLTRLMKLAPPSNNLDITTGAPCVPFRSPSAQTILISHYVDSPVITKRNRDDTVNRPLPWPMQTERNQTATADRVEFLEQSREQLCLEIAGGSAGYHSAQWIKSSKRRSDVLLPGSLRQRGEFSLVYIGLVPAAESSSTSRRKLGGSDTGNQYTWQVLNVDFHRLNHYPDD